MGRLRIAWKWDWSGIEGNSGRLGKGKDAKKSEKRWERKRKGHGGENDGG